jgi:Mrp family chromosome partitioning ATPase
VPTAILVLVGAVFGAALGIALAIWLGLGDKRLHQVSDLERFGLFVIGSARRRHDRDGETTRQLLTQSTAELDDDVRIARIVLTARAAKSTTLVVAPAARFPRSNGTTVAALAAALARTHTPVTLVDAASDLLGGADWEPGEYGLADALTLGFPLERVAVETQPHLTFVPWGRPPSPGTDILSTRDLAQALTSVEQEGGWLLISAPPLDRPESLALASMLGKVVLRVELGRTTLDEVQRAVDEAARCGAEIVGALVETSSGIPWTPGARGPGATTTVALSERLRAGSEPVSRMARAPRTAPKT